MAGVHDAVSSGRTGILNACWRLITITPDEQLRHRELARRKALWTLAPMKPGDPRASSVLDVLDYIELWERHDKSVAAHVLSVEEILSSVPTEPHPIGFSIVRESNIPQPWRERFLGASLAAATRH